MCRSQCPDFDNFNNANGTVTRGELAGPTAFAAPRGLRVIVYDGGSNDSGDSPGLDRAWLLCFRYYGCTFYPVDNDGSLPRPGKPGPQVHADDPGQPDNHGDLQTEPRNLSEMKAYKNAVMGSDVADADKPCWMAFEVVYPGQARKWGVGDDRAAWQEANIVLYLVPRVRYIVPPA